MGARHADEIGGQRREEDERHENAQEPRSSRPSVPSAHHSLPGSERPGAFPG
jgi:hypothetical protein